MTNNEHKWEVYNMNYKKIIIGLGIIAAIVYAIHESSKKETVQLLDQRTPAQKAALADPSTESPSYEVPLEKLNVPVVEINQPAPYTGGGVVSSDFGTPQAALGAVFI